MMYKLVYMNVFGGKPEMLEGKYRFLSSDHENEEQVMEAAKELAKQKIFLLVAIIGTTFDTIDWQNKKVEKEIISQMKVEFSISI